MLRFWTATFNIDYLLLAQVLRVKTAAYLGQKTAANELFSTSDSNSKKCFEKKTICMYLKITMDNFLFNLVYSQPKQTRKSTLIHHINQIKSLDEPKNQIKILLNQFHSSWSQITNVIMVSGHLVTKTDITHSYEIKMGRFKWLGNRNLELYKSYANTKSQNWTKLFENFKPEI